jgi:hypothetical protein
VSNLLPQRKHLLTITRSADWHADQPDWDWSITCSTPDRCNGWWECRETHEVGGLSAADGPFDCELDAPWSELDEFDFHGVPHVWRYGYGWTVRYPGCVVQTADVSDEVWNIATSKGPGVYVVDDDWDDTTCYLTLVAPTTHPTDQGQRQDAGAEGEL